MSGGGTGRTPNARRLAEIVAELAPGLRARGFRKRRHVFNRELPNGFIQMVKLTQGSQDPPGAPRWPGLPITGPDRFTAWFGVWIPEMDRLGFPRPTWVAEWDCDLSRTAGMLESGGGSDRWWALADPAAVRIADSAVDELGIPWLEALTDHDAVVAAAQTVGTESLGIVTGNLEIGWMLRRLGRDAEARSWFERCVDVPLSETSANFYRAWLPRVDASDLLDAIVIAPDPELDISALLHGPISDQPV